MRTTHLHDGGSSETPEVVTTAEQRRELIGWGFSIFPLKPRSKKPATEHGFLDAPEVSADLEHRWQRDDYNVGIACGAVSGNIGVIDLDLDKINGEHAGAHKGELAAQEWQAEHGEFPPTVMAKSGSGGLHLYYHFPNGTPATYRNTDAGVDFRGEGGYIVAPPSIHDTTGNAYTWISSPAETPFADANESVCQFIEVNRPNGGVGAKARAKRKPRGSADSSQQHASNQTGKRYKLPKEIGKGARNEEVFRYASSLRAKNLELDEARVLVSKVNAERCKPPLPESEVLRCIDSAWSYPQSSKPSHEEIALQIKDEHSACIINGEVVYWDDGCMAYLPVKSGRNIDHIIMGIRADTTRSFRMETNTTLELLAEEVEAAPLTMIPLANGVYDAEAGRLLEASPDIHAVGRLPTRFNPDANDPHVLRLLDAIASDDTDTKWNLAEVIAYSLCRGINAELQAAPFLLGSGSNGKSTFLGLIQDVLGRENYCAVDLGTLGERFQTTTLIGMTAAFCDDAGGGSIPAKSLGIVKSVISGDLVPYEIKGGNSGAFRPNASLVLSGNLWPRYTDPSDGFARRLHIIPLENKFPVGKMPPEVRRALKSDAGRETVLKIGLETLPRLLERGSFSHNPKSAAAIEAMRQESDSVRAWCSSIDPSREIDRQPTSEVYGSYKGWCDANGNQPVANTVFGRRLKDALPSLDSCVTRTDDGKSYRFYRLTQQ